MSHPDLPQWLSVINRTSVRDEKGIKWLRVLGAAEPSYIDPGVGHQLHAIVPTLLVLEPQQQPLEFGTFRYSR